MTTNPLSLLSNATQRAQLAQAPTEGLAPDPTAIIDRELARLFAARELFMQWVESGNADIPPHAFLRAWGDSTTRVLALLKARRDLATDSTMDALLDAVYNALAQDEPAQ